MAQDIRPGEEKTKETYVFAVFPYLAAGHLSASYAPVAGHLSQLLGRGVRITSTSSYEEFSRLLQAGVFDVAVVQPFDFVAAVDDGEYEPLARVDSELRANFAVRSKGPIKSLSDLRGKRLSLPPKAAAVSRMALKQLRESGLEPAKNIHVRHFKSFDSCLHSVLAQRASACATGRAALRLFQARMRTGFRIVAETPSMAPVAFVAHKRLPVAERLAIKQAILAWHATPAGKVILIRLGFPGFRGISPGDYDVVRHFAQAETLGANGEAPPSRLRLGVFPYFPPQEMAETLAPLSHEVGRITGQSVDLRTTKTFIRYMASLEAQLYDVALIQPFDYGRATTNGYEPLARMKADITTVFYVGSASPLQRLKDLKGKTLAMPPYEAGVSRVARKTLREAGMNPEQDLTILYRRSHDSCVQLLREGGASACVTSPFILDVHPKESEQDLKVLHRVKPMPGLLFVAHTRLPGELRQRLREAIFSWHETAHGRQLLSQIRYSAFGPVEASDYACCISAEWDIE